MLIGLIFAAALLLAVLISGWTTRSMLSNAVLFLLVGFFAGNGGLHIIRLEPTGGLLQGLAELALISVLFSDSMKIKAGELVTVWKLPGRALLLGLPLTLLLTAVLGHYLLAISWLEALLVGAVLAPTDPIFAAAIVGRREVPRRLRQLLNIESGVNDGLALPFVLVLLTLMGEKDITVQRLLLDLGGGILLGIAVPGLAIGLLRIPLVRLSEAYEPFFALAVGLITFSLAKLWQVNEFLAAFAAGVTMNTCHPQLRDAFREFGELVTELLKLATLMAFGSLLSWDFLLALTWREWLFVALILLLARPAALSLVFIGSQLEWKERLAAFWFGPRGFASVFYGIMVLHTGAPHASYLFGVIALVVVVSITAHSSTDAAVARWFRRKERGTRRPASD